MIPRGVAFPVAFALTNEDGTPNSSALPTCWVAGDDGDFAVYVDDMGLYR